jgi:hypothetical protein
VAWAPSVAGAGTPAAQSSRIRSTVTTVVEGMATAGVAGAWSGRARPEEERSEWPPVWPWPTARASRSPSVCGVTASASGPKATAIWDTPNGQTRSSDRTVRSMLTRAVLKTADRRASATGPPPSEEPAPSAGA